MESNLLFLARKRRQVTPEGCNPTLEVQVCEEVNDDGCGVTTRRNFYVQADGPLCFSDAYNLHRMLMGALRHIE